MASLPASNNDDGLLPVIGRTAPSPLAAGNALSSTWREALSSGTRAACDVLDALLPRDGWSSFSDRAEDANAAMVDVSPGLRLTAVPSRVPDVFIRSMCRFRKEAKDAMARAKAAGKPRPRLLAMDPPRAVAACAARFQAIVNRMGLFDYWSRPAHERVQQQAVADRVSRQHAVVAAAAAWRAEVLQALGAVQDDPDARELFSLLAEADGVHVSLAAATGIVLSPEGAVRFGPVRLGDCIIARATASSGAPKAAPPCETGDGPGMPVAPAGRTLSPAGRTRLGSPAAETGVSMSSAGARAGSASCSPGSPAGGRPFFGAPRPRSGLSAAGSGSLSTAVSGSPKAPGMGAAHDATAGGSERVVDVKRGRFLGPLFDPACVLAGPAARCGEIPRARPGTEGGAPGARRPKVTRLAARAYLASLAGIVRLDGASDAKPPPGEHSPPLEHVGGEAAERAALGDGLRMSGGRLFVGPARVSRAMHASAFSASTGATSHPSVASAGSPRSLAGAPRSAGHGHQGGSGRALVRISLVQLLRWWLPELQPGCEPPGANSGLDLETSFDVERGPLLPRLRLLHMFRCPAPPTTESTAAVLATIRGRVASAYGFAATASFDTPEERQAALLRLRDHSAAPVVQHAREALAAARDHELGRLTASALHAPSADAGRGRPQRSGTSGFSARSGSGGGDSLDRAMSSGVRASPAGRGRTGSCCSSPVLASSPSPKRPAAGPWPYPVLASLVAPGAPPPGDSLRGLGIGALASPAVRHPRSRTGLSSSRPHGSLPSVSTAHSHTSAVLLGAPPPSPSAAGRAQRYGAPARAMSASLLGSSAGTPPATPPASIHRHTSAPASAAGSSVGSVASTMPLPLPARAVSTAFPGALPAIQSYAESETPSTARSGGRRSRAGSMAGRSSPASSFFAAKGPSPAHWKNPSLPLSVPGAGECWSVSPGGQLSHIVRQVVSMGDMRPLIEAMVDAHPGSYTAISSDTVMRSRYVTVVIARLVCILHGQMRCDVTATEILESSLAKVFSQCHVIGLERVLPFRPSDAIAMSRTFDELTGPDKDYATVDDAERLYERWLDECDRAGCFLHPAPFVVPMDVVERAMMGHARQLASGVPGTFNFEDWVFFELAQADRMTDSSVEYWFALLDRDGDGVLNRHDVVDASKSLEAAVRRCQMLMDPSVAGSAEESDQDEPSTPRGSSRGARREKAPEGKGRVNRAAALLLHVRAIVAATRRDVAVDVPLHSEAVSGRRRTTGDAGALADAVAGADDAAPWAVSVASAASRAAASSAGAASDGSGRARSAAFAEALPGDVDDEEAGPPRPVRVGTTLPRGSDPPLVSTLIQWCGTGPELFRLMLCTHSRSPDPAARQEHWLDLARGSRLVATSKRKLE